MRNTKKFDNQQLWVNKKNGQVYKSKRDIPLNVECEFFASVLEYKVFMELLKTFPSEQINRQHLIEILPGDSIFKPLTWKVDFYVDGRIIEAKGEWILKDRLYSSQFVYMLALLKKLKPELFNTLIIVSEKKWRIPATKIETLEIGKIQEILKYGKQPYTVQT